MAQPSPDLLASQRAEVRGAFAQEGSAPALSPSRWKRWAFVVLLCCLGFVGCELYQRKWEKDNYAIPASAPVRAVAPVASANNKKVVNERVDPDTPLAKMLVRWVDGVVAGVTIENDDYEVESGDKIGDYVVGLVGVWGVDISGPSGPRRLPVPIARVVRKAGVSGNGAASASSGAGVSGGRAVVGPK